MVHLIEEYKKQVPFEEAVWRTLAHIEGTYGLAIIDRENPEKLIVARNGSPLVLGVMEDGYIVASDVAPIVRYTDRVIYLEDGEMAEVEARLFEITNFKRKKVEKEISKIDWSVEEAEKKGYPHFMLKEIMEQPEAVENSIRGRLVVPKKEWQNWEDFGMFPKNCGISKDSSLFPAALLIMPGWSENICLKNTRESGRMLIRFRISLSKAAS